MKVIKFQYKVSKSFENFEFYKQFKKLESNNEIRKARIPILVQEKM